MGDEESITGKSPYNDEQRKWLDGLKKTYDRIVVEGICMATIRTHDEAPTEPCEGKIGRRHAIARRHLKLLIPERTDDGTEIRANKDYKTFMEASRELEALQLVPVSEFSAGRWACQRHDEIFAGIDAQRIDLSEPENLFKAVYRVVVRQTHLMLARWNANFVGTQTEEGWERFKETAFSTPVSDEKAASAWEEWRDVAHTVMGKMRDLKRRLASEEWNSLEYRAVLLESKPTVAAWGCLMMKFGISGLPPDDLRRYWDRHIELGYMIVIPQQGGHAIITACEPDTRFRVPEIVRIHKYIPVCVNPNQPYSAGERLKREISRKIWELSDEIGMRESLYQSWSAAEQKEVQEWMKQERWMRQPTLFNQPSSRLPNFF